MAGYDFDLSDNRKKKKRKKKLLGMLFLALETVAVVVLAFFLVRAAIERTVVPGEAMSPTLAENTSLIVNKLSYLRNGPERFDVIVFEQEGEEHRYYHVMRVIGVPGDRVQIVNGSVYIDGELLKETVRDLPKIHLAGLAAEEFVLDEDEYFVLGDNRNKSEDSRFANIGNVTREQIIGKAWLCLDPFNFVSKLNLKENE